jgi:protein-tyrosine-phosphatase
MTRAAATVLLVGGAPHAALAVCRGLARSGLRVGHLGEHATQHAVAASRHCAFACSLAPDAIGVAAWGEGLRTLVAREQVVLILPLDARAHALLTAMPAPPARAALCGPAIDRAWLHLAAAASGWRTLASVCVRRDRSAPATVALPTIVLPQQAAVVIGDELVAPATRRVADAEALEAKLREELPRLGVLLQTPATGAMCEPLKSRQLRVAAVDGEIVAWRVAPRDDPPPATLEAARHLLQRCRATGLLAIECLPGDSAADAWHLVDLHPGAHGRAPCWSELACALARRLLPMEAARGAPQAAAFDPAPALALAAGSVRHAVRLLALRLRALGWREPAPDAAPLALREGGSVLFVCQGNINRSLVAEQVLRAAGRSQVASAGLLHGAGGRRPSRWAEAFIAAQLRLPTPALRSRSLDSVLREGRSFDHVVCFERRHVVELLRRHPRLQGRVHLLAPWCGERGASAEIADPNGHDDEAHRRCFARISVLLQGALDAAGASAAQAARARDDPLSLATGPSR